MLLNQLSISYKCHSAIGNSLNLDLMIKDALKVFIEETDAVYGSCYLTKNNKIENIFFYGKNVSYNINEILTLSDNKKIIIKEYNESVDMLLYKLDSILMVFMYDKIFNLEFISSMYESFRQKLNISVDSCLNVQKLKKKNQELKELNLNLVDKIKEAVVSSKEKEKQFFEQLKMAQMGELIGNIAHQWRQPLSIISTAASGMRLKKEINCLTDEDFFYYSDSILNNSTFLSNTIDEFRDYIKESQKEKQVVIQDRVKMAFKLVENGYNIENIKIIPDYIHNEPINFKLVLGELLQVMIAILNNAREALVNKKVENKWVKYSVVKDEYNVIITIEDNAGGIEESILDKIFNPYFTTKHQFQGTGIGLYSSYDIVVNHLGGNLEVENTIYGAKFFIKLPLHTNYSI